MITPAYEADSKSHGLQIRLQTAVNAQDWKIACDLAQQLAAQDQQQAASPGTALVLGPSL
jgi:hypothetical protein